MRIAIKFKSVFMVLILPMVLGFNACRTSELVDPLSNLISRIDSIPPGKVKILPENDDHPPILHSNGWHEPVLLDGPINSAGLEDSPYITADGKTLFFFFTPAAGIQAEDQIEDGATGIYWAQKADGVWREAERVLLGNDILALDGCPTYHNGTLWFCSAREGNYRPIDFWVANWSGTEWQDVRNAGAKLNKTYDIGEMDINPAGTSIYFHKANPESADLDILITNLENNEWNEPIPINIINSPSDDSRPALSPDGNELWFTRTYEGTPALFRSSLQENSWQEPELIISRFAGEPAIDQEGNIYFTHHFFKNGIMVEADIYIARKIQ